MTLTVPRSLPALAFLVLCSCGPAEPSVEEAAALIQADPVFRTGVWMEIPRTVSSAQWDDLVFRYPMLGRAAERRYLDWAPILDSGIEGHRRGTLNEEGKKVYAGWYQEGDHYVVPYIRFEFHGVNRITSYVDGEYHVNYMYRQRFPAGGFPGDLGTITEGNASLVKRDGKWILTPSVIRNTRVPPRRYDEASPYRF
jgi:hypothetical protein